MFKDILLQWKQDVAENLKESRRKCLTKNESFMKKFRMMLPVLAVIFAMVGAVAGDFLPSTQVYYEVNSTTCSQNPVTIQDNCFTSDQDLPLCTVSIGGGTPKQAYQNSDCSGILKRNQ